MSVVTRHSPNRVELMKWGLVPSWAEDPKIGYKMINARAEGIQDKPSLRTAIEKHRCLVPSSGYFEWKREGTKKVPYYFRVQDQKLFAFASLYETWHDAEGWELIIYTIITTAPNQLAAEVHDRMPVILQPEDEDEWLDPALTDAKQVVRLLGIYNAQAMVSFPVSSAVGSAANNDPSLVVALAQEQPSTVAGPVKLVLADVCYVHNTVLGTSGTHWAYPREFQIQTSEEGQNKIGPQFRPPHFPDMGAEIVGVSRDDGQT